MRFGDYECFSVETGKFELDGGAMFGVVPKILWERKIPANEKNLIPMQARSLLIQGKGKNILIDTGIGNKLSEKLKKISKSIVSSQFDFGTNHSFFRYTKS